MDDPAILLKVGRIALGLEISSMGGRNRKLSRSVSGAKVAKESGQMKWSGQQAGSHFSLAACADQGRETVEIFDFAGGADAEVEIIEGWCSSRE